MTVVVSVLAAFGPPMTEVSGGLDSSWQLGLSWARTLELRWGRDLLFTYGPWGTVAAPVPLSAALMWQALLVQLATASIVAWACRRLTEPWGGWPAAMLCILVTSAAISSGLANALFAGIVLYCFALVLGRVIGGRHAWLLGGLAGFSVLIKFNTGCAAVAIGTLAVLAAPRWRFTVTAFLSAAFAGAAGGWLAAGQRLADFIPWMRGSAELAVGYSSAMRHVRDDLSGWLPFAMLAFGMIMTASFGALAWLGGWTLALRARVIITMTSVASVMAIYLASATRLDAGHLGLVPCSLFALGIPLASAMRVHRFGLTAEMQAKKEGETPSPGGLDVQEMRSHRLNRFPLALAAMAVVAAGCVGFSVAVIGQAGWSQYLHPITSITTLLGETKLAVSAGARESSIGARMAAIRDTYPVPEWELTTLNPKSATLAGPSSVVVEALRGERVHVEPWAISLAWAHDLAWDPVPVIQTYAAYTSRLDELNANALLSANGPTGILRQSAAIDGKNPLWESPRYQRAMLCNFTQRATDGRWQALVRVPSRCGSPRTLGRASAKPGEIIPVPSAVDAFVIAELSPRPGAPAESAYPVVYCGTSAYRLAQGFVSAPLVLRATASGWDRGTLPAECGSVGANRSVDIVFTAIPIRNDVAPD